MLPNLYMLRKQEPVTSRFFNRSGATQAVALDMSKTFDRV